jgi:hypothetical protein
MSNRGLTVLLSPLLKDGLANQLPRQEHAVDQLPNTFTLPVRNS